jgi:hypothetical protein
MNGCLGSNQVPIVYIFQGKEVMSMTGKRRFCVSTAILTALVFCSVLSIHKVSFAQVSDSSKTMVLQSSMIYPSYGGGGNVTSLDLEIPDNSLNRTQPILIFLFHLLYNNAVWLI